MRLAVSPDGRWLATVAERSGWRAENPPSPAGGVIDLWDLGTGQHIRRLAEWLKLAWNFQPATMAAFTADGRVVLAPGTGTVPAQGGRPEQPSEGAAALLDPLTPRWVRSFPSRWNYYTAAIAVSPDGRTLYVSGDSSEIVAFEVATGKPRRTIYGHAGCVRSLAMASDGRRLLSGSDDAFALLWDTTPAGAAKPRKEPLTEADADGLWTTLAGDDASSAFAAMADLAAAPDRAVALVRRELKPVRAAPTDDQLDRTFADLDSEDFATRQKASRRLAEFGESAVPGVRKRLAQAETLEVRRRAQEFLDRFDPPNAVAGSPPPATGRRAAGGDRHASGAGRAVGTGEGGRRGAAQPRGSGRPGTVAAALVSRAPVRNTSGDQTESATPGSELLSKYRTEAPKGRQFQDVELRLNCEDGHCLCAFLFRCGRRLLRRIRHSESRRPGRQGWAWALARSARAL